MLVNKIERDIKKFRKAIFEEYPFRPLFVKLKLVWDCNLRCKMCNHWRTRVSEMPLEFFKNVVFQLHQLGCRRIHLSGGEPLLFPGIFELMEYIHSFGIKITMTTNATLINEKKANLLIQNGLQNVNISVDSPYPEVHDHIRGIKNSYQRTIRGIKILREKFTGKIQINMVVNPENYQSVIDVPDFAHEIQADSICLIPIKVHTPDLPKFTVEQLQNYNQNIAPKALAKALMYGLVRDVRQIYVFGTKEEELLNSSKGLYAQRYYETHPCYALWSHALIDHLGRVSVCCYSVNQPIIGDLRQNTFEEIWFGEKYRELRNQTRGPLEDCKSCTMFQLKNDRIHEKIHEKKTLVPVVLRIFD